MKKTIFALMAITVLGLAACQKTETPDPGPTPAETASGTYTGTMEIALGDGEPFELPDQTITITASGESSIDLTIADFALDEFTLGTISMTGCSLMENATDGSITTESEQTITVGEIGDCAIKLGGAPSKTAARLSTSRSPRQSFLSMYPYISREPAPKPQPNKTEPYGLYLN